MERCYFDTDALISSIEIVKEAPKKKPARQDSFTINELLGKLNALVNDCALFFARTPILYSMEEMESYYFASTGAIIYDEDLRKKAINEIIALIRLHLKSNDTKRNKCHVAGFYVVYIFGLCMSKASAPFRLFFNNALSRVPAL
jgi:hypothetical protein